MEAAPEPDQPPWWRSDDETFAGATPLFPREERGDTDQPKGESADSPEGGSAGPSAGRSASDATPDDYGVGSAIAEGLKLAAAVSAWSNASGLTDTLRSIATEATEALTTLETDDPPTSASSEAPEEIPHESVCDYCPLCRGLDVMRTVQPQMSRGMAESMASLTSALNFALESLASRNQPPRKQT